MSIEFPIRDNYSLDEFFDYRNLINGFQEQQWGELTDSDRWNPAHFGDAPRVIEESGQVSVFFDPNLEPPDPDDYRSLQEYEQAWQEWEFDQKRYLD
ncbi:hypothetical protein [Aulosira sp. FACHB-615]|uniref:hypothetical protein n=1 Tax=Aulosira sp. FACHB-615 TaxID=2692777 RepID=UPI0016829AA0|nr:hypothetical protein [Aulosira sp. FACHB-615]MBD2492621.1 hypothetical protein [Aulosira sp. FACHB-615]